MLLLLALACPPAPDTGAPAGPRLEILAPSPDQVLQVGVPAELSARVLDHDGVEVGAPVRWWAEGWDGAEGSPVEVDDLPYGDLELVATVVLDGEELHRGVAVRVRQVTEPTRYDGVLDLDVDVWSASLGETTLECTHDTLSFTVQLDGSLAGAGRCHTELGSYDYGLQGQVDVWTVTGVLVSTDAPDQQTPLAGTRDPDGHVEATFDETFFSDDGQGSLRLYGRLDADPE